MVYELFCVNKCIKELETMDLKVVKTKAQYYWLDLIRGLAALAVFTGHLRILCYRDAAPSSLDLLGKVTYFLTGFGHISLIIFFVLSGFLIIKSIHQSDIRNNWNTFNYAQNRFFRLWVVLIPALVFGLALDKVGLHFWGDSLFYSNKWKYFFDQDLANKLSLDIFIGNAFFVQKILVPTLGSNGALWSLANEFWYYVIFPLLYFAFKKKLALAYKLILSAIAFGLLYFVGYQIAFNFAIWLMGGLSYIFSIRLNKQFLTNKIAKWCTLIIFISAITFLRFKLYGWLFNNYTISILFALCIPFLIHSEMRSNFLKRISTYFSDISYTLYLAHLPFIYLISSMIGFQDKMWSVKSSWLFAVITLVTVLYSTLLYLVFERNTKKIRAFFTSKTTINASNHLSINSMINRALNIYRRIWYKRTNV
jgi:peptidoglycan/LPS O-acetylase OafA/YrhL